MRHLRQHFSGSERWQRPQHLTIGYYLGSLKLPNSVGEVISELKSLFRPEADVCLFGCSFLSFGLPAERCAVGVRIESFWLPLLHSERTLGLFRSLFLGAVPAAATGFLRASVLPAIAEEASALSFLVALGSPLLLLSLPRPPAW